MMSEYDNGNTGFDDVFLMMLFEELETEEDEEYLENQNDDEEYGGYN